MKNLVLLVLFINSLTSFAQIKIGGEDTTKEKGDTLTLTRIKGKKEAPGDVELVFGTNWSMTNRRLIPNDNIFGDSLGLRANEVGIGAWSYGLGFRTKVNKNVMIEGGLAYIRNGEKYTFSGADTLHSYVATYNYLSMPIKVYFTYGEKKLRWMVGVGGIPQMSLKHKRVDNFKDSDGVESSESENTKTGFNSFVFSIVANAGIQYKYGTNWSIYVMPEYRMQLASSYLPTNKYKHYGTSFGVSFGLVRAL
jgi:hypothetical protein